MQYCSCGISRLPVNIVNHISKKKINWTVVTNCLIFQIQIWLSANINSFLLADLNWRFKWAFLTAWFPSSVRLFETLNIAGLTAVWLTVKILGLYSSVVKALAQYAKDPGFESWFRLDLFITCYIWRPMLQIYCQFPGRNNYVSEQFPYYMNSKKTENIAVL